MQDLTRRSFMGVMGAMGAVAAAGVNVAMADEAVVPAAPGDITSPELAALGGSNMSLNEINRRRHEIVDSKGEYTCADGTVIPAVYVKLRALINTYGFGFGSEVHDHAFDFVLMNYSEDEAQAYLEMPYGVTFTAQDFADASGRDEASCMDICNGLAARGLLWRAERSGMTVFHHVATAHGIFEYNLDNYYVDGWVAAFNGSMGADYANNYLMGGTPFYYSIPCGKEVVADEQILLHDDYEAIIRRHSVIGVSPCQCRLSALAGAGVETPAVGSDELKDYMNTCGHPLETCISTGEEAAYYIGKGIARQIDQEEALSILKRSVDAGMVLQSAFTKDSDIICSCHGDCCSILGTYQALGTEGCAVATTYPNNSHYNLVVDTEACLKCGACAERCPMFCITVGEQGAIADARCMRCGQCGLVCPQGIRKLEAKPADQRLELPSTMMDTYNTHAGFRFEHDMIW